MKTVIGLLMVAFALTGVTEHASTENLEVSVEPVFSDDEYGVLLAVDRPYGPGAGRRRFQCGAGVGWPFADYYRGNTGAVLTYTEDGEPRGMETTSFTRLHLGWNLGYLHRAPVGREGAGEIGPFLLYRGRYDKHWAVDGPAGHVALQGVSQHTVAIGARVDTVQPAAAPRGFYGEIAYEVAPSFANRAAQFSRAGFTGKVFVPLVDASGGTGFSLYLAEHVIADHVWGAEIPMYALRSTGGIYPRYGLGGLVRGIEQARFDTETKLANSLELRALFPPAIRGVLVPGALVYLDAGVAHSSSGALAGAAVLASTGVGVFVNMFDAFEMVAYAHYLLVEPRLDGSRLVPFELGFGFHF